MDVQRSPEGVSFLTDRIPEPGRTAIEDELWSWVVRGEDDADEFVDYFDDDEERCGATDDELRAAHDRALAVRREQQRAWGEVRGNLTRAFVELNELGCWPGRTSAAAAPARTPRSTTSGMTPGTGGVSLVPPAGHRVAGHERGRRGLPRLWRLPSGRLRRGRLCGPVRDRTAGRLPGRSGTAAGRRRLPGAPRARHARGVEPRAVEAHPGHRRPVVCALA
ncbi:hypothetical protein NKG94_15055 [Micromonospora sp. M12]